MKKLKWREFIGVKCLWGTLTDKNNPFLEQNRNDDVLMKFPGHYDYMRIPLFKQCDGSQEALCGDYRWYT